MKKSVLIVAGETSGDNLGAGIIEQWNKINGKNFDFWGFGGEKMLKAGVRIVKSVDVLSVIGFWEGIKNYRRLNKYLKELVETAKKSNICGAILIDYPGFNLKLARELKSMGIPVFQVASPQIWAWHYNRIYTIKKFITEVLCLYKFEIEIYKKENIPAYFIGHPVIKKTEEAKKQFKKEIERTLKSQSRKSGNRPVKIALLPGSRTGEIARHMPFLLDVAAKFHEDHPEIFFEIPTASQNMVDKLGEYRIPEYITLQKKNPYLTMATSNSAIVCSGTATLECAVLDLPFVLIYRTSPASYYIGRKLIRIPYIGLVNVIAGKFITREFIQNDMKILPVMKELHEITFNKKYIKQMQDEFKQVRKSVYSPDPDLVAAKFFAKFFKRELSKNKFHKK